MHGGGSILRKGSGSTVTLSNGNKTGLTRSTRQLLDMERLLFLRENAKQRNVLRRLDHMYFQVRVSDVWSTSVPDAREEWEKEWLDAIDGAIFLCTLTDAISKREGDTYEAPLHNARAHM
jgi:hypothetical protein